MITIGIVFDDISTGVKWDTSVRFSGEDGDDYIPSEGSEQFKMLVQQAVENIWGNMYVWKTSGRYDTGRVAKKNSTCSFEYATGMLKTAIKK